MKAVALLLAALLPAAARAQVEVEMMRVTDGGAPLVSSVRVTRGPTVVVALELPRGERLMLRRGAPEAGVVSYQAWTGGPPGVTVTRRGGDPLTIEVAGRSLRIYEADLPRSTVRCWLTSLVASTEARLLELSAGIRALREEIALSGADDAYTPIALLWQVSEAGEGPRGPVKAQRGPFKGDPWARLQRAATDELGRR
jgi:hypothetical protein